MNEWQSGVSNYGLLIKPIGGVGLQMHIDAWDHPPRLVATSVSRLADLGLKINISEMDVRISGLQSKLETQRRVYYDIISASIKEKGFMSVTFWGLTLILGLIQISARTCRCSFMRIMQPAYWGLCRHCSVDGLFWHP